MNRANFFEKWLKHSSLWKFWKLYWVLESRGSNILQTSFMEDPKCVSYGWKTNMVNLKPPPRQTSQMLSRKWKVIVPWNQSSPGTRGFLKRELASPAPTGGRAKRGTISNFPSPADAYDVTRSCYQGFPILFIGILHQGFLTCIIKVSYQGLQILSMVVD